MAETPIIIIGGVRYRRDDAQRLGISVKTPKPPATLAEAEAAAGTGSTVISTEAGKAAGDGATVSGDAGAAGDADETTGRSPRSAARARKS